MKRRFTDNQITAIRSEWAQGQGATIPFLMQKYEASVCTIRDVIWHQNAYDNLSPKKVRLSRNRYFTPEQAVGIRQEHANGASATFLSRKHKAGRKTIYDVLYYRASYKDNDKEGQGPMTGGRYFTISQAAIARKEYADGISVTTLARRHNATPTTVRNMLDRKGAYKDDPECPDGE